MVFGTLIYVSVLCLNAVAILNEERFLSRGECARGRPKIGTSLMRYRNTVLPRPTSLRPIPSLPLQSLLLPFSPLSSPLLPLPNFHPPSFAVGWSPASIAYEQQHSFSGGPGGPGGPGGSSSEASVKERLINLISAVRTLLRSESRGPIQRVY